MVVSGDFHPVDFNFDSYGEYDEIEETNSVFLLAEVYCHSYCMDVDA